MSDTFLSYININRAIIFYYNKGQNKSMTKIKPHYICLLQYFRFLCCLLLILFMQNIFRIKYRSLEIHLEIWCHSVNLFLLSTFKIKHEIWNQFEKRKWEHSDIVTSNESESEKKKKIGTRSISKILDTMGCARSYLESSRCFSPLPALHP